MLLSRQKSTQEIHFIFFFFDSFTVKEIPGRLFVSMSYAVV